MKPTPPLPQAVWDRTPPAAQAYILALSAVARGGASQEIGEALRSQARQMFHWWHRVLAQGSRFVEVIMTVVATLKQHHRNPLDYLTAACEATLRDEIAPSLLPTGVVERSAAA